MTVPVLCEYSVAHKDGLAEDAFVFSFAFSAAATDDTTLGGIFTSVDHLFNTSYDSEDALGKYLGHQVSRDIGGVTFRAYNLTGHTDGSPHGSPFYVNSSHIVPTALGSASYPSEVACRMSVWASGYTAVPETVVVSAGPPRVIERPKSRFRGGFFFGPLVEAAGDVAGDFEPRPSAGLLAAADRAWTAFMDERGGDFCVWSRKDGNLRLVAPSGKISVDNAFDTIKKRGPDATARTTIWP